MPTLNRTEIWSRDEVQVFHLINRCVRRMYLCGKDRRTGKDYSHRKEWIRDRLEELAGIFGRDILGFCVISNHLHVVARTRPDAVKAWSDDEVALRWWRLFPQRRNEDYSPAETTCEVCGLVVARLFRRTRRRFGRARLPPSRVAVGHRS